MKLLLVFACLVVLAVAPVEFANAQESQIEDANDAVEYPEIVVYGVPSIQPVGLYSLFPDYIPINRHNNNVEMPQRNL